MMIGLLFGPPSISLYCEAAFVISSYYTKCVLVLIVFAHV